CCWSTKETFDKTKEERMSTKTLTAWITPALGLLLAGGVAFAAGQYGPGSSDTEIKLGNTMPYSGPASAYGAIGKAEVGYFQHDQRARRHQRPAYQFHHPR